MSAERRIRELRRRRQADPSDEQAAIDLLVARSHIEGPGVYWEVLADRVIWQGAFHSVQDLAIKDVTRVLEEAFRFKESKVYSRGGESHRIATFCHSKTGCELNLIPGGTYIMGRTSESSLGDVESPAHEVVIGQAFLLGRTAVTQEQWMTTIQENPSSFVGDRKPIEKVSWSLCQQWLEEASDGLRFPSESEWEFACRAGTSTRYYFGDLSGALSDYAWFEDNSKSQLHEVALLKPNAFGLFDMHGNIDEWCEDHWIENYTRGPSDHQPMKRPNSPGRSMRGGDWESYAGSCESISRTWDEEDYAGDRTGLRLARSLSWENASAKL